MPKLNTFYNKLPKDVTQDALELQAFFEQYPDVIESSMKEYFQDYWAEFQKFWTGEQIDWIGFACIPHNGIWFTQYVFQMYPKVREQVMVDLKYAKENL